MSVLRRNAAFALMATAPLAACFLSVAPLADFPVDASDAASDGTQERAPSTDAADARGVSESAAPDAAATDAGTLADGDASSRPDGCGARAGADGASFCIDATEVTIGQYFAFLQAKSGDVSGQPAECAWN